MRAKRLCNWRDGTDGCNQREGTNGDVSRSEGGVGNVAPWILENGSWEVYGLHCLVLVCVGGWVEVAGMCGGGWARFEGAVRFRLCGEKEA